MLLKSGMGSADRRTEYGERGTLSGERGTRNRKRGAGNDSLLFRPFFRVVIRPFKLLCGLSLYCRSQFLFLVSRSPVPDFNNIHLVLTQIQTVVCVSVSLKMCVNILFHYLRGCKMNCFRTVGLINTSVVYAVPFCCCWSVIESSTTLVFPLNNPRAFDCRLCPRRK